MDLIKQASRKRSASYELNDKKESYELDDKNRSGNLIIALRL